MHDVRVELTVIKDRRIPVHMGCREEVPWKGGVRIVELWYTWRLGRCHGKKVCLGIGAVQTFLYASH